MASKRVVVVVLGLATLGGILSTSVFRIVTQAQQAGSSPPPTTHSIKVAVVNSPGGNGCELYPLSPDEAGVYPSDTVVFNVENGCDTKATVVFSNFRLVSPKGELRLFQDPLENVAVGPGERRHLSRVVQVKLEQLKEPHKFAYTVEILGAKAVRGPASSYIGQGGIIYICSQPPCPPRG